MTRPNTTISVPAARIAGQDHAGVSASEILDPATGTPIASTGFADEALVGHAVGAAESVRADFTRMGTRARAAALAAIARDIRAQAAELAPWVAAETGKRISEARGEVEFTAKYFDWFAEGAADLERSTLRRDASREFHVSRRAAGVSAALATWNFPLSIPGRKIAPAIAAGSPVVLKPSELAPVSSYLLTKIAERHLPDGTVSFVLGDGELVTNALLDDPRVTHASFTGSTAVGHVVAARAAATMTRVTLELGGRAPFIITHDADRERAIQNLMVAKFRNNGASCIAANNVFIHESLYDDVVSDLAEQISALTVGDPFDEATDLGPAIAPRFAERLNGLTSKAEQSGDPVVTGKRGPATGTYVTPALIEVDKSSHLWAQEIFGPLMPVQKFTDEAAIVNEVNSWRYGLAGYVCSQDVHRAEELAESMNIGIVGINNGAPNTPEVPFGGFGESGIGREGSMSGIHAFVEEQTITIQHS